MNYHNVPFDVLTERYNSLSQPLQMSVFETQSYLEWCMEGLSKLDIDMLYRWKRLGVLPSDEKIVNASFAEYQKL